MPFKVLIRRWVGVYILGPHGPFQWTLLWNWEFLPSPQPPQICIARGFESLVSPPQNPGFLCISLPNCSSWLIQVLMWDYPVIQPCLVRPAPVSNPPTSLDECFFNSLVVGLLCSLIFQKFWLVFVFKLVVILLLVVWGNEVFLPTPPSWPDNFKVLKWKKNLSALQ